MSLKSLLTMLLHVVLFVAAIIGLLAIKQRRLRHIPTRRTHISRRSAEGTVWLQRAVNAVLDMLHCALAEQKANDKGGPTGNNNGKEGQFATSTQTAKTTAEKLASAHCGDSDSDSDTEVLSDLPFLNALKAQLEEQISALLEDKGIASFADFRIKDWGGKPPLVKAVCLSHGGGSGSGGSNNNGNNSFAGTLPSKNGGANGGPSVSNGNIMDGTLAGQRGDGSTTFGPRMAARSSAAGSPNALGPQHYPSFSGNPLLSASATCRGTQQLGASLSFTNMNNKSTNPTFGEHVQNGGLSAAEPPCAGILSSMRYRNTNTGLLSNGEEVGGLSSSVLAGRECGLVSSTVHPHRMLWSGGGGSGGENHNMNSINNSMNNGMSVSDLSGGLGFASSATAAALSSAGKNTTDTTRSLSVLEVEAEVEYSGNFSASLSADIPIARGRYLQVYASISDVRMLAAHIRLRLALEYKPATVESPQSQPYLLGTLWLISDPVFDVAFHSSLTQYRIRDFFLIPKLIKFFLLRAVRNRLRPSSSSSASSSAAAATAVFRHANARRRRQGGAAAAAGSGGSSDNDKTQGDVGALGNNGGCGQGIADETAAACDRTPSDASGLTFRIQLPPDVVDGGEQWWSAMARDTMSERPAPFLRTYHQ